MYVAILSHTHLVSLPLCLVPLPFCLCHLPCLFGLVASFLPRQGFLPLLCCVTTTHLPTYLAQGCLGLDHPTTARETLKIASLREGDFDFVLLCVCA